jgi:hypothetical protein
MATEGWEEGERRRVKQVQMDWQAKGQVTRVREEQQQQCKSRRAAVSQPASQPASVSESASFLSPFPFPLPLSLLLA